MEISIAASYEDMQVAQLYTETMQQRQLIFWQMLQERLLNHIWKSLQYTGWQWRNFVPHLRQLIFATIL